MTVALFIVIAVLQPDRAAAQNPAPVPLPSSLDQWEASFLRFRGTWTHSGGRSFQGQWINGAVATLKVERFDTEAVIVIRSDTRGMTPGIRARYTGKIISPGVIEGTVTWEWPGVIGYPRSGTWGATFEPGWSCGESSLLPSQDSTQMICNDASLPFRYNNQSKAYHLYDDFTPICNANQSSECTVEKVFEIMSGTPKSIAPVAESVTPAQLVSCSVLQLRSCPGANNDIRIVIDKKKYSVTNYTLPSHLFYPGHVRRQIVKRDGAVGVYTVGEGVGCLKALNLKGAACKIWPDADQALKVAVWDGLHLGPPPPLRGSPCSLTLGFFMWVCDRL